MAAIRKGCLHFRVFLEFNNKKFSPSQKDLIQQFLMWQANILPLNYYFADIKIILVHADFVRFVEFTEFSRR